MDRTDRVGTFLQEKTPRRAVSLGCFLALIVLFRHLLPLLVLFVAFERGLSFCATWTAAKAKLRHKHAVLGVVFATLALLVALTVISAGRIGHGIEQARDTFPEHVAALRTHPLYQRLAEHLPGAEELVDGAKHYASEALHLAAAVGHLLAYALIAAILALIFVLEQSELTRWRSRLDPQGLGGTLLRWTEHVADAISVTVQLQLVVAACNTALTLPMLFLLGIDHKLALMLLIFVSGLLPVVGNILSGAVLSLMAYRAEGWVGVGVFVALTFVLHKVEAYYLNPRLTARHVALPGFVLVTSLIAWEHLLGFAGLFVSFPVLFVVARIRAEIREEDATQGHIASEAALALQSDESPRDETS